MTGSSEFQVTAGYRQNVVGFGWTNGVYLEMEACSAEASKRRPVQRAIHSVRGS
jgi:alpha,alpha-trehalase